MATMAIGEVTNNELDAWREFSCIIVEAVKDNAAKQDSADHIRLVRRLDDVLAVLRSDPSHSKLLVTAGTLSHSIEDFLAETRSNRVSVPPAIPDIIAALAAGACDGIPDDDEDRIGLLRLASLESPEELEKLAVRKSDLLQALDRISAKRLVSRRTVVHSIGSAPPGDAEISHDGAPITKATSFDPTTGLPNRDAAEDAIAKAPTDQANLYAVVFHVQRMERFNARFGDKCGNEVLLFCSQLIVNRLIRPTDRLFRWRGPSFVALLQREDSQIDVRQEIRGVVGSRLQFEWRNGSLLLSIGIAAHVIPLTGMFGDECTQEVERFLLLPTTRG